MEKIKTNSSLPNYLILAVSIIALSFAGPLVKKTEEAGPFALGFLRLGLSTLLVLPFGRPWQIKTSGYPVKWAMISGFCFFVHLGTWFYALRHASVAVATTMLALQPVVVIALEYIFFKKRPKKNQMLGIGIAIAGTIIVVFNSLNTPELIGVLLMVVSLVAVGLYLMASMKAQEHLNAWQTVSILYPTACLCFGAMAIITGQPILGHMPTTYGWIASVAVIPTFFGHSLLNYSCKSLSPVIATTATLAEPFIASLIAWVWLRQGISIMAAIGAVIVIIGIFVTINLTNAKKVTHLTT